MGVINILDESVSNIIAAGEVVENPSSMVKELIENSIDSGANMVRIYIENSGRYVKIVDNGSGMDKDDLYLCTERHATSKIRSKVDIFQLTTYGFRGEALASIASVSKVYIASRTAEKETGHSITVNAGKIVKSEEVSKNVGTEIEVKDLFFNTPARLKFLRKKSTEYTKIRDIVLREALSNYDISFSLVLEGKETVKTSGRGIQNTLLELFGKNVLKNLMEFQYGFVGNGNLLKSSKEYIFTYVNGRYVKSQIVEKAVVDAYYTKLMKGKYPFAVVFLEIDPSEVDVNVHPSKKIVKFSNNGRVYNLIRRAVEEKLYEDDRENTPVVESEENENNFFTLEEFKSIGVNKKEEAQVNFKDEVLKTKTQPLLNEKRSFEVHDEKKPETTSYHEKVLPESTFTAVSVAEDEPVYAKESVRENRVIGQLNNMYILVEGLDGLEIYDQHIVHERILYEELKDSYYKHGIASQSLLVPLKLELDYTEKKLVEDNLELLLEFGFELEEFGEKEMLVRAVPVFDFRSSIEDTFNYMLSEIKNDMKQLDFREKVIISMSCRNAIKAGEKLKNDEMELLIGKLHKIGKYTCPHGRPIIIRMPYLELEKRFGRRK